MSRRVAWVALCVGVLVFLIGVFILGAASSAFANLGQELDLMSDGYFSRILALDLLGRNMQEEWNRSLLVLYVVGAIAVVSGGVLMGLGAASLLSRDDWRRR